MVNKILFVLLALFAFCATLYCTYEYMNRPYVFVSYTTKKCVRIEDAQGGLIPCSKLKTLHRYEHIWVQQHEI